MILILKLISMQLVLSKRCCC